MAIEIRRAQLGDTHGIATIRVTTWRSAYAGVLPQAYLDAMDIEANAVRTRTRLAEEGTSGDWVAVDETTPVGWGSIAWPARDEDTPRAGEICAIYVLPSYWGCGVGHGLMEAMADELRHRGASSITLWVLRENAQARRFYERRGFRCDGAQKQVHIGPEVTLAEVRYRRTLGEG